MTDILLPDLTVTVDFNPSMLKPIIIGPVAIVDFNPSMLKPIIIGPVAIVDFNPSMLKPIIIDPVAIVDFNPSMLKSIAAPALPEESCVAEDTDVFFDDTHIHYTPCNTAEWVTGCYLNDLTFGGNKNDTIHGGPGNDTLIGNGGNDIIVGGRESDTIVGGNGIDFMFGGWGADFRFCDKETDVFQWFNGDISAKTQDEDTIYDFEIGIDKIDLSGLDANLNKSGNQHFKFTGTSQHYRNPKIGEIYFCKDNSMIYGNVDNDSNPELQIFLLGVHNNLTKADFIL